jgi:hypothetical protein
MDNYRRLSTEEEAKKQYPTKYLLDKNGDIQKLEITGKIKNGNFRIDEKSVNNYKKNKKEYNLKDFESAVAAQKKFTYENTQSKISKLKSDYEGQLSQNTTYNTLIDQISGLTRGAGQNPTPGGPASIGQASAFGGSSLQGKLNFQVSDDDIINDYNKTKQDRLNRVVSDGNTQIAGINTRLEAAQNLYDKLPNNDARKTSAKVMLDGLKSDLASVQGAVSKATDQINNYTPITPKDDEGLRQITSFREYARLPEERASDQLRQIDPKAYETAVGLGQQYRDMATQPIGPTTTSQTEQLRNTIEQEALNQLRLGSTIGAEERRGYEQAIRGAQTARGNIFGLGPAVQEAAQLGAAGEARKLARFGAAQQFLGSGETTGAAAARDLLLRDNIQQSRLGAASGFVAGGPSIYNLANQRLGQQNAQFQGYIQANQSMPGSFQTQGAPANFYQTTNPEIPVQLSGQAGQIYNTTQNAQASMYGSQVDALSRVAAANSLPNYLNAGANLISGIAPKGLVCWVAREVYGEDNPKWLQFREWILTKASDNLRNFYIKYGERIAESIRNKPKIKSIIRKWMDSKIG